MSDVAQSYVYILYREDGVTPFYVGKGTGKRLHDHERLAKNGKGRHKDNIILQMKEKGIPLKKEKIAENLTHDQAFELEKKLIEKYGRIPNGILANVTAGGKGIPDLPPYVRKVMSEKAKARTDRKASKKVSRAQRPRTIWKGHPSPFKGVPMAEETKAKLSAALKGRIFSEESRKKMSDATKLRNKSNPQAYRNFLAASFGKHSPERVEKNRQVNLGKTLSEDHKKAISEGGKRGWITRRERMMKNG